MSDVSATPTDARLDIEDDQALAEAFDEDKRDTRETDDAVDVDDYASEVPLATLEARAPINAGDVPPDSLEDRLWREVPDRLPAAPQHHLQLVEAHPDFGFDPAFAAESEAEFAHAGIEAPAADAVDAEGDLMSAEEAAMHEIREP